MIRGTDGRIIPSGRVRRSLTADLLGVTAFPAWLIGSGSAVNWILPPLPDSLKLTAAASGGVARLRTTFDLDSTKLTEISWTIESLICSSDANLRIALEIFGTNRGLSLVHTPGAETAVIREEKADTTAVETPVPYQLLLTGGALAVRRRNVTLAWRPREGYVYVLEDDQVVVRQAVPNAAGGVVRPGISITTTNASTGWMQMSQIKMSIEHN